MIERARMAVVVGDTMDSGTLQSLGDACARVGAEIQVWKAAGSVEHETWPALVIAALAAGVRQLPEPIIELADRRFPGTQVLLVCDEPLVRPTLTLQRGRLTLIEPPATVERMASRIRLLLATEPDDVRTPPNAGRLAPPDAGAFVSQEFRRAAWWAAQLACGGAPGDLQAPRPWLGLDRGMTAVLTAAGMEEGQVESAADLVRRDLAAEELSAALERTLDPHAGLVHLTEDGRSWLIYWPCPWRPLWLFSTQRLPRWSNLALSANTGVWRLPAVAGDVVAALSSGTALGDGPAAATAPPPTAVSTAMLDGGPALLAFFEARLASAPRPFSCLLAEVR